MTRSFWAPAALAMAGGLLVLLATGATWVDGERVREIGGVAVREPLRVGGAAFAPAGIMLSLAGVAGAALLATLRGRARQVAGAVVALVGVAAVAVVVVGAADAAAREAGLTAAPFVAAVGSVALAAAGLLAVAAAAGPPRASRYRVDDEQPVDAEWDLAADDDQP